MGSEIWQVGAVFAVSIWGLFYLRRSPQARVSHDLRGHNQRIARQMLRELRVIKEPAKRYSYLRYRVKPLVFEDLVLVAFQEMGWVSSATQYTGDGGSDGEVRAPKTHLRYLVQSKRYRSTVPAKYVIEFNNLVMSQPEIEAGYFVHCGKTSKNLDVTMYPAVQIISGEKLMRLIDGTLFKGERG